MVSTASAILGIWDGHDSGAALIKDGVVAAAVNEERLSRKKLDVNFPQQSIAACLEAAGAQASDIQQVAVSTYDLAKTVSRVFPSLKERYYAVRRRKASPGRMLELKRQIKYEFTGLKGFAPANQTIGATVIRSQLRALGFRNPQIHWVDHHLCHAAAAALTSGFPSAAVLTLDGVGDGLSGTVYDWDGRHLSKKAEMPMEDSIGIFFEQLTFRLNMRELEDEGKAMALACLAREVDDADNPLLQLFAVDGLHLRACASRQRLFRQLDEAFWKWPSEQVAWMAQRLVELRVSEWAEQVSTKLGKDNLALAGGVFANVKANRMLRLLPGIKNCYVFPHMGDGGLALGAAAALWNETHAGSPVDLSRIYLGPSFSDRRIEAALNAAGLRASKISDLAGATAELLMQRQPLAWFQGRMEYGPRALGARSILALPHDAKIRDLLNRRLKQRVWYQPYCPVLLDEEADVTFSDFAGQPNRHMTMAYMVKEELRDGLQAVTAGDGSCRPQMVGAPASDEERRYHAVLTEIRRQTGRGILLNTSFNLHGEPLVNSPEDAVRSFLGGHFRAMIIGDFLVQQP